MATADRYMDAYENANELRFGRREAATVPELLRIHRALYARGVAPDGGRFPRAAPGRLMTASVLPASHGAWGAPV
jgi:hypothetical protein